MAFGLVNVPGGGLTTKQDKLIGRPGQIVVFDQNGNAVAQNGVTAFKGRTGAITPQAGDYTAEQVGALPADATAVSAQKLSAVRTFLINLASTAAANFDGSTNVSPGVTGILPLAHGGTGANSAAQARTNLGAAAAIHKHSANDINSGTLPITRGGTGATSASQALANLGALPLSGGTITGNLRLKNSTNYGCILNFGDGDYVHISEPADDKLEIKGSNVDLVVSGRLTKNGADIALKTETAAASHTHGAGDIVSGTFSTSRLPIIPLNKGGTGATTAAQARTNLGAAAAAHTHSAGDITSGTLPLARGGTNATTAAQARTNLGAAAATHTHGAGDITSGALSIARGGTNATTASQALANLGGFARTGGTISGAVTVQGAVDIQSNSVHIGSGNYGSKINLGDGDFIHFSEPTDDNLEIKAKNINFVVTGDITKNGSSLASNKILSYAPSSLNSGEVAFVYV